MTILIIACFDPDHHSGRCVYVGDAERDARNGGPGDTLILVLSLMVTASPRITMLVPLIAHVCKTTCRLVCAGDPQRKCFGHVMIVLVIRLCMIFLVINWISLIISMVIIDTHGPQSQGG